MFLAVRNGSYFMGHSIYEAVVHAGVKVRITDKGSIFINVPNYKEKRHPMGYVMDQWTKEEAINDFYRNYIRHALKSYGFRFFYCTEL